MHRDAPACGIARQRRRRRRCAGRANAELSQQSAHVQHEPIVTICQTTEQVGAELNAGLGLPVTLESGVNTPATDVYCVSGASRETWPVSRDASCPVDADLRLADE